MNRLPGIVLAIFLAATGVRADLSPAAWQNQPLATAINTNNEWYSFPDSSKNPRILVKATGTARKLLTGGPPVWTESPSVNITINQQGTFVPTSNGGGYLVAPHGAVGAQVLKVAIFGPDGNSALETIDGNAGTYTGISGELDASGVLHLAYAWNASTICYARRSSTGSNPWIFTSQPLTNTTIHDTAIVPISTTSGNQTYDAYLYYSATGVSTSTGASATSLWQSKPGVINNQLYIQWLANDRVEVERFVGRTLRGSRIGSVGRVFYFGSGNSNSWKFKRFTTGSAAGTSIDLETAGNVSPGSIRVALGLDGKQRVAWYNETTKSIHYLKPNAVDVPALAGIPVVLTGTLANPDLLGLHFGPDGTPYLLYRRDGNEGFVAFPSDNFDLNRNGRPDLLDTALGSPTASLVMQPVGPAYNALPGTENRFKFLFPTVGSANSNGQGSLISSSRNLTYAVETSTNGVTWTPVTGFSSIAYFQMATTGTSPNEVRTYLGVLPGEAPGSAAIRLARLKVTRSAYPY